MKDFLRAYKRISDNTGMLVKTGMKLAIGVLLIGVFTYYYNQYFIGNYHSEELSLQIIQKAWSLFAIFILGGLILDCYEKSR